MNPGGSAIDPAAAGEPTISAEQAASIVGVDMETFRALDRARRAEPPEPGDEALLAKLGGQERWRGAAPAAESRRVAVYIHGFTETRLGSFPLRPGDMRAGALVRLVERWMAEYGFDGEVEIDTGGCDAHSVQ